MVADTLFRSPRVYCNALSEVRVERKVLKSIIDKYSRDVDFGEIHKALKTRRIPKHLVEKIKQFELDEGMIIFLEGTKRRLCILHDLKLREELLQEAHDARIGGHLSIKKTIELLSRSMYWPGMAKSVQKFVTSCDTCQRNKPSNKKPAGLLQPLEIPKRNWQHVTMDLIVQLPKTKAGHDAIVVFVYKLSKMSHLWQQKLLYQHLNW